MAVKVFIPTPLRAYTDHNATVEVEGRTVDEVLRNLTSKFGEIQRHLYAENGSLRSYVNVYVNDEDIRYLQRENTPVKSGDTLSKIAKQLLGDPNKYNAIFQANSDQLKDPNMIKPGQRLKIPRA